MYAENLLGITQNFLTPDIVNKFSNAIGETTERTQKGLKSVIPTLLLGIVNKGQTEDGAEALVNIVNKDGFEGEKKPNYVDDFYLMMGSDAVEGVFGNNLNTVVTKLGDTTGIQSSGIEKMLKMAAPLVMGFLGTKMKREGLGAPGLMGFLKQQKNTLSKLVPGGLVGRLTEGTPLISKKVQVASDKVTPKEKPSFSFMIGIFVLSVLFGLWWFTGRRNLNELTSSTESVLTTTRETASEVVPTLAPIALPSISELGAFLQSGSAELPKSFRFDNLSFNTGTLTLAEAAGFELDQVASWLKEFPNTLIRIEGHSDSVGSESKNLELSSKQAGVIKEQLIARGINGERIEVLGMGSLLPLATNSNEAGRAQNRRIELVVTRIQ